MQQPSILSWRSFISKRKILEWLWISKVKPVTVKRESIVQWKVQNQIYVSLKTIIFFNTPCSSPWTIAVSTNFNTQQKGSTAGFCKQQIKVLDTLWIISMRNKIKSSTGVEVFEFSVIWETLFFCRIHNKLWSLIAEFETIIKKTYIKPIHLATVTFLTITQQWSLILKVHESFSCFFILYGFHNDSLHRCKLGV